MEELATTGTLHHFVPNVKFSRLQRSLKKIHSEELDSGIFGLVVLSKINFHNKISNKYKEFN